MPTDAEIAPVKAKLMEGQSRARAQGNPATIHVEANDYICSVWNTRHGDWMPVFHLKHRISGPKTATPGPAPRDIFYDQYVAEPLNTSDIIQIGDEQALTLSARMGNDPSTGLPDIRSNPDGSCDLSQADGDTTDLEK
jgi:hypothetical protein